MKLVDRGGWYAAENAVILGEVRVGEGASIWYGAVVRGDMASVTIGEMSNVQDGCVLHCDPREDLVVGRHVTIGHHAVIHGLEVGDLCLIGTNATLLARCRVGEGSIVGAGSVVREGQVIPPRSLAVGVPARVVGRVTDEQLEEARDRAERYLATAYRHLEGKVTPADMHEY